MDKSGFCIQFPVCGLSFTHTGGNQTEPEYPTPPQTNSNCSRYGGALVIFSEARPPLLRYQGTSWPNRIQLSPSSTVNSKNSAQHSSPAARAWNARRKRGKCHNIACGYLKAGAKLKMKDVAKFVSGWMCLCEQIHATFHKAWLYFYARVALKILFLNEPPGELRNRIFNATSA